MHSWLLTLIICHSFLFSHHHFYHTRNNYLILFYTEYTTTYLFSILVNVTTALKKTSVIKYYSVSIGIVEIAYWKSIWLLQITIKTLPSTIHKNVSIMFYNVYISFKFLLACLYSRSWHERLDPNHNIEDIIHE